MIYTQPVVYEFPLIRVPTLLMIGDKDTTAIGKDTAPPEVRAKLGHYPELAQTTKAAIPGSRLIEFPDAGHAPQIQEPDRVQPAALDRRACATLGFDAPIGRYRSSSGATPSRPCIRRPLRSAGFLMKATIDQRS